MATRADLQEWVLEALKADNGRATVAEVCKHVWTEHENDLRQSENLLYTWQYDIRWAAMVLRKQNKLRSASLSPRGVWELV
jgi:hypothetical protein